MTQRIDQAQWVSRLDAVTTRFATTLTTADLTRPVPGCPGWRLADLAHHLGNVHAWAEHAVVARSPELPEQPAPSAPDLAGWYAERARSLVATLAATEPDAPAWAFGIEGGDAGFWRRRQTHETTVHLWDAARSQGAEVSIDSALAHDGIDEVVDVLFPRQVRLGRSTAVTRPVALQPTDVDVGALVLGGDGLVRLLASDAAATVCGPASALMLLLWKRIPPADGQLVVSGDPAAYLDLLGRALTP